jgi:hypothetical protein
MAPSQRRGASFAVHGASSQGRSNEPVAAAMDRKGTLRDDGPANAVEPFGSPERS